MYRADLGKVASITKLKYFLCWIFSEVFCGEAFVSEKHMVTVRILRYQAALT